MRGVLAMSVGALAATVTAASSDVTCATGLYIITVRGSGEPVNGSAEGFPDIPLYSGSPGYLAFQGITPQIPGSVIVGLPYQAVDPLNATLEAQPVITQAELHALNLTDYFTSENNGTKALIDQVNEYHEACPDSKIAILGYSQGAQIVRDALCGGTGDDSGGFNSDAPLSPAVVKSSVIAVGLMGDPTHIANQTINRGNSTNDGVFPRTNTTVCDQYSDFTQSWCNANDLFCDQGTSIAVHESYLTAAGPSLVEFVLEMWAAYNSTSTNSTSTATPSASASASSTVTGSTTTPTHTGAAFALVQDQSLLASATIMVLAMLSLS